VPTITFITSKGEHHPVEVAAGVSLMNAAVDNRVPGIDGDCGGQCACATCHVFIDAPWAGLLPAPTSTEDEMLNFTAERVSASRLACQITVTDALDGIAVRMPQGQH
jgi:2Fe-2S ferredoxin